MHYYEVAPNRIFRTDSAVFTYNYHLELPIGQIVLIEVGNKKTVGIVVNSVNKPKYKTKEIISIIEDKPLPIPLIKLAKWISEYYVSPIGLVLQSILPAGIQKNRRNKNILTNHPKRKRTNFLLNNEQSVAINTVINSHSGTFLLQGVTGSGKTQIYIELTKKTIADGKSAIILVPEISLTPQLISEFSNHFSDVIVTHSNMSEADRHNTWRNILNSEKPLVIIGPRSALFVPLENIGLIVVDESHEPSYKQEQSPKYSALRVASVLGKIHNAKVIFGSATPSVTDRYLAEKSGTKVLKLSKVAVKKSIPPTVDLVDMKVRDNFKGHRFLSDILLQRMSETLSSGKQVLIFHNRRGSTSTTICSSCGWVAECPNCHLPLSLHSDQHLLKCHICSYSKSVPTSCPICGDTEIIHKGIGTKLVESELRRLFPKNTITRFDGDSKSISESDYSDIYSGKTNIIIGTQIIAKGLDLPNLRTVGVIQADAGLILPDYGSSERVFQLLSQVIGRVGRNQHKTNVVVQTYRPSEPTINLGLKQDYEQLYKYIIDDRKRLLFPPFVYLLKINCVYKTEAAAIKNSQILAKRLRESLKGQIQVLGPTPAFYEHIFNSYRWQIIVKSKKREILTEIGRSLPQNYWQFELDPTSLL